MWFSMREREGKERKKKIINSVPLCLIFFDLLQSLALRITSHLRLASIFFFHDLKFYAVLCIVFQLMFSFFFVLNPSTPNSLERYC